LLLSQIPPALVRSLHLIGGVFLLFLAWSAYRTLSAPPTLETTNTSVSAGLLKATLANLLNPNPYLFWSLVAGPLLLESWRQSPRHAAGFLLGFYLTLIGGFAAQIIVFATAGRLDKRLTKILGGLSALVLLLFGLYQIRLGIMPDSP
jgi:threonine/homoserine/homoserine lactone efflux protein